MLIIKLKGNSLHSVTLEAITLLFANIISIVLFYHEKIECSASEWKITAFSVSNRKQLLYYIQTYLAHTFNLF